MDIVERLREDARGPALEAADEIERLREALEARPSNEELKLAEKHCDWNAFKHAFGAVMKHRLSALQQKESEGWKFYCPICQR